MIIKFKKKKNFTYGYKKFIVIITDAENSLKLLQKKYKEDKIQEIKYLFGLNVEWGLDYWDVF